VAENSGGVHCLKYGLTLHNVLAVKGFTADGEAVEFGGAALDAPGYDLLALVTGSEGMLAVTTEVTVKLLPKPRWRAASWPASTTCARPATPWPPSSPPASSRPGWR
jgi:FAD/FMN-containing dehydrogenase